MVDLTTVGPDAPIVENERGGKQSHVAYRYDLIPPEVLERMARIFDYGAKRYEPDNWKLIGTNDHINHVFTHLIAFRLGDTSDDHLGHAAWRLLAAYWTAMRDGYDARQPDEKIDDVTVELESLQQSDSGKPSNVTRMCLECKENPVPYTAAAYCAECKEKYWPSVRSE